MKKLIASMLAATVLAAVNSSRADTVLTLTAPSQVVAAGQPFTVKLSGLETMTEDVVYTVKATGISDYRSSSMGMGAQLYDAALVRKLAEVDKDGKPDESKNVVSYNLLIPKMTEDEIKAKTVRFYAQELETSKQAFVTVSVAKIDYARRSASPTPIFSQTVTINAQ